MMVLIKGIAVYGKTKLRNIISSTREADVIVKYAPCNVTSKRVIYPAGGVLRTIARVIDNRAYTIGLRVSHIFLRTYNLT